MAVLLFPIPLFRNFTTAKECDIGKIISDSNAAFITIFHFFLHSFSTATYLHFFIFFGKEWVLNTKSKIIQLNYIGNDLGSVTISCCSFSLFLHGYFLPYTFFPWKWGLTACNKKREREGGEKAPQPLTQNGFQNPIAVFFPFPHFCFGRLPLVGAFKEHKGKKKDIWKKVCMGDRASLPRGGFPEAC